MIDDEIGAFWLRDSQLFTYLAKPAQRCFAEIGIRIVSGSYSN